MIGTVHYVTSLDDPGLDLYRTLKRSLEHRRSGLFVAEGTQVVARFLESSLHVVSALMTGPLFTRFGAMMEENSEPITVYIAEKKLLETIVGFECHQGIMAVGKVPQHLTLDQVLDTGSSPRLYMAMDGLTSAENTGVLVRNCAACGVGAIIAGETSADPWLRRSVRNSMGTIFQLPIVYASTLAEALRDLRTRHGFTVLAAHPRPDSVRIFDADFTRDTCIVFGAEGDGVSEKVLAACNASIAIPMADGVDSFNVACAGAVVLYEAMRQRMRVAYPVIASPGPFGSAQEPGDEAISDGK